MKQYRERQLVALLASFGLPSQRESIESYEQSTAEEAAKKMDDFLSGYFEEALEQADIPDRDDIIDKEGFVELVQEHGFLDKDDFEELLEEYNIADEDTLGDYVKNEELEDALNSLDVVRKDDLDDLVRKSMIRLEVKWVEQMRKKGFFGRLRWLFTGR